MKGTENAQAIAPALQISFPFKVYLTDRSRSEQVSENFYLPSANLPYTRNQKTCVQKQKQGSLEVRNVSLLTMCWQYWRKPAKQTTMLRAFPSFVITHSCPPNISTRRHARKWTCSQVSNPAGERAVVANLYANVMPWRCCLVPPGTRRLPGGVGAIRKCLKWLTVRGSSAGYHLNESSACCTH